MNEIGMGLGMGPGMWIFWIVTFLIIVLIIKVIIGPDYKTSISSPENPLKILEKRYAQGEIEEAEYERRKKELED